jgi:hypothetical protein
MKDKERPARELKDKLAQPGGLQFCAFVLAQIVIVLLTAALACLLFDERPTPRHFTDLVLRAFMIWVLAFTPGWMFLRFFKGRATALWNEYVINLHRLRWDAPRNLPKPPRNSTYYDQWLEDKKTTGKPSKTSNIYRDKFAAYYFQPTSHAIRNSRRNVRPDTLFPIYLATLVLTVCWTAFLWNPSTFEVGPPGHLSLWSALAFSFLGAYAFIIQMLMRRFYHNDLRASAYLYAVTRIVIVSIITIAILPLLSAAPAASKPVEIAVLFVIGFFPTVGFYAIHQAAAKALRRAVPPLQQAYPLGELDGLNIWYETLLLEEGIEDMQSLTTANLIDVILHTSVPVGRMVDWIDQAYLYLQLAPKGQEKSEPQARRALRDLGIRTATDLLSSFPPDVSANDQRLPSATKEMLGFLQSRHVEPATVQALVRVLSSKPGLNPVLNWQDSGVVRGPRRTRPVLAPRSEATRPYDHPPRPPTGRAWVLRFRERHIHRQGTEAGAVNTR